MRSLLEKYQQPIIKFANTQFGRRALGIEINDRKIVKVGDNFYAFHEGGDKYTYVFRTYPLHKERIEWLLKLVDLFDLRPSYKFSLLHRGSVTTYISNTGGDGFIYGAANTTWATARGVTDGTLVDDTNIEAGVWRDATLGYQITRGFIPFDTSGIADGASITAAVVRLAYVSSDDTDNDAQAYITVVQSTQGSNTALASTDIDNIGATDGSDHQDITGLSSGDYDFTLNATGLTWISKTGYTPLAIREGHDLENATPSAIDGYTRAKFASTNTSGTASDPRFLVTVADEAGNFFSLL